ncbi:MAG: tetratricopeptide repeat protein [Terriglobia bacterium]
MRNRTDSNARGREAGLHTSRRTGVQRLDFALVWLLTLPLLAAGGWAAPANAETGLSPAIVKADSLYQNRSEIDNVRQAIAILRREVAQHPDSYAAWWRIAQADCYLARHVPGNQQESILEDGVAAGRKAEALKPDRPEGHFWVGANEGLLAEDRGLWGGLTLIDPIRDEMRKVMKLDPNYMEDGAERILGRLYYEAPFFKGGNKRLSVSLLENCLKLYPGDSLTMIYLAASYRATGRRQAAREMLERVLRLTSDPANGPELANYKAEARKNLRKYFHADS